MINIRFANPLFQYGLKSYDLIIFNDEDIIYRSSANFKEADSDEKINEVAVNIFNTLELTETISTILIDKPNGNI